MLTGDKGETAESIGHSCGLLGDENQVVFRVDSVINVDQDKNLKRIWKQIQKEKSGKSSFAFLIDGTSLSIILQRDEL